MRGVPWCVVVPVKVCRRRFGLRRTDSNQLQRVFRSKDYHLQIDRHQTPPYIFQQQRNSTSTTLLLFAAVGKMNLISNRDSNRQSCRKRCCERKGVCEVGVAFASSKFSACGATKTRDCLNIIHNVIFAHKLNI